MNENRADPEIEYRVIGPPGCGKTTWLGNQVENAVENGRWVLITSQTRAAAEIGGRRLPMPEENLGIPHSHCFKALGHPEEWNERHPALRLTTGGKTDIRRKMDGEMSETRPRPTGTG